MVRWTVRPLIRCRPSFFACVELLPGLSPEVVNKGTLFSGERVHELDDVRRESLVRPELLEDRSINTPEDIVTEAALSIGIRRGLRLGRVVAFTVGMLAEPATRGETSVLMGAH